VSHVHARPGALPGHGVDPTRRYGARPQRGHRPRYRHYTIATQVAAELLGLDVDRVQVEIGYSDLPPAPYSAGSGMATSLSGAINDAVGKLVQAFVDVAADDESSPLRGRSPDDVTTTKGGIHVLDAPSIGETYIDILARHGLPEITADGEWNP
jgi:xanthine dehydrogenase YagR molybdenum-binding subunit